MKDPLSIETKNQITQILKESNRRMQRILKGKYTPEQILAEQRKAEIQIKTIKSSLKKSRKEVNP